MNSLFDKKTYTQKDIDLLIKNEVEESLTLEYKAAPAIFDKKEIAKDVSAFANSAGGIIIYGIEEVKHKPKDYSYINGSKFTKEYLEQVISSNIQKRLEDVLIIPIRIDSDIEKSIYIVKIPESFNAPHQANDKFYRRFNFESVPMHEYEIRNLYNRTSKTKLEIEDLLISLGGEASTNKIAILPDNYVTYKIGFQIKNDSNSIEKLYKLEISFPTVMETKRCESLKNYYVRTDGSYDIYSIQNSFVLFQNEITTLIYGLVRIYGMHITKIENFIIKVKLYYSNGVLEKEFDLQLKMLSLWQENYLKPR